MSRKTIRNGNRDRADGARPTGRSGAATRGAKKTARGGSPGTTRGARKPPPKRSGPAARKAKKPAPRRTGISSGAAKKPAPKPAGVATRGATKSPADRARIARPASTKTRGASSGTTGHRVRRSKAPRGAELARRLLKLEETMQRRVIGKDEGVQQIARVVRVRMAELDFRPVRPRGSFLLVGPTGVGKNELAFALAEALYGSEEPVVSIDLAEIAEEADLAKLGVTLLPGEGNQAMEGLLTSPVRKNPRSVVLLRGVERAHAAIQPILQQVLERGRLDDMAGSVDFSQTVIFVTTRPRRDDSPAAEIGFTRGRSPAADVLRKRLERILTTDLLDAFNEIIEVPPLTADDVRRIARYKVEAVLGRLRRHRRRIEVAEEVYTAFLPEEEVLRDGVAILHRSLEDRLFNPLAVYLLSHASAARIRVEIDKGVLKIRE